MSEESYSAIVREHLEHPRNAGAMPDADTVGVQSNPICGDTMKLMLRIADGRIVDARWQTVGCEPALATSSVATELVKGKTLDAVAAISREDIERATGGLPLSKRHCSALAADALHRAIAGYRSRLPDASLQQT